MQKWESNPDNDSVRYQLAVLLSQSPNEMDRKEALHHFSKLSTNPMFVNDSLYHISLTHYYLGDYEKARCSCEQLYRLEPDDSNVSSANVFPFIKVLILIRLFNYIPQ